MFAKPGSGFFCNPEKLKEIGRHSYKRQVLQRKLLVLVHSVPPGDWPGTLVALQEPQILRSPGNLDKGLRPLCFVPEQKHASAQR